MADEWINNRMFLGGKFHQLEKLRQPLLLVEDKNVAVAAEPPASQLIVCRLLALTDCCPFCELVLLLYPEPVSDPRTCDRVREVISVVWIDELLRKLAEEIRPACPSRHDAVKKRDEDIGNNWFAAEKVDDVAP